MSSAGADIQAVADHGGSLERGRTLFPTAPRPFVDLTTGINPHSYPVSDLPATAFSRLPEPGRIAALAAVAGQAYGAAADAGVVAAPGSQLLLPLIAGLVQPGQARILGPTYAEHRRAAALAGHDAAEAHDPATLGEADLAVVVNPNNPDGRLIAADALLALADRLARRNGLLVVDEAFMDVQAPGESLAAHVGAAPIVVVRSFGKFFGLAGVRLGFAIAAEPRAEKLAAMLGPWAVSGPALELGLIALADQPWQGAMRARLSGEAARLDRLLAVNGIAVIGGTSLFRTVELDAAAALFDWLGRQGILVRRFDADARRLRFGLPGDAQAWQRLEQALSGWHSNGRPAEWDISAASKA